MNSNRRFFLKTAGIAGLGLAGINAQPSETTHFPAAPVSSKTNMCGYAAPPVETVRIGVIGLGNRGAAAAVRLTHLEGVRIIAVSDLLPSKTEAVLSRLKARGHQPQSYSGTPEKWKELCGRDDIDLVYIATPWRLHTPMAVYAMQHRKHVCVEVPAAQTVEECWQLVETSEQTRKHCMMLENACYDQFKLLTLNLVRQGILGEVIHCEGAYIHDLLAASFAKDKYQDMWRLKENMNRQGNLYPTHGIGPVCQVLDINRGDCLDYILSVSGNDFMTGKMADELASEDPFYRSFAEKRYRGNMNLSILKTKRGKTIQLQHDVTSPRPRSRGYVVSGSKGTAVQLDGPGRISLARDIRPEDWKSYPEHEWLGPEQLHKLEEAYNPAILKRIGDMAKQIGGHGGMDLLMDWRTIDCLRNGLPLDQDVYDAALWSAMVPLSEKSVSLGPALVRVPDFTRGAWKSNPKPDLFLEKGGNTNILL